MTPPRSPEELAEEARKNLALLRLVDAETKAAWLKEIARAIRLGQAQAWREAADRCNSLICCEICCGCNQNEKSLMRSGARPECQVCHGLEAPQCRACFGRGLRPRYVWEIEAELRAKADAIEKEAGK